MPMMKSILGLDVGSHSIKAAELQQNFRGFEVAQLRLQPRDDAEIRLSETLSRFFEEHEFPGERVVCAIQGDRISSRRHEFPFRDRKKLAAAVPFELEGDIPFELEDVVIDWDLVGGSGRQSSVAVAMTRRQEVGDLLHMYREAGLEPRILEPEGMVLGNLSGLFDLEGTRVLADLGHRKSTLCLLIDGRSIAATTVSIGGLGITRAIAEDRRCSLEEAEQLKCSEGILGGAAGSGSPTATKILERLAREILRFVESQEVYLPPEQDIELTLLGGTSKLAGIENFLAQRIGLPVETLQPPSDPRTAEMLSGADPVLFAQALALAIRGSAEATTRMNFRQDELAYKTDLRQIFIRDLRPTVILVACALGSAFVSLITTYSLETSRARALEKETRRLYQEAFPGGSASNPVPALSAALRQDKERADFLGIYGTNLSALDLLAELSRRIPDDLNVRFDEININRRIVKVKVTGETYEAADRLKNLLAQAAPFTYAEVDKVKSARRGKGKTFNLTISLGDRRDES
jgi:general secretion pathway protein L